MDAGKALKWIAGIVASLGLITTAVVTTGGWVTKADESHVWTEAHEAPVDVVIAQTSTNTDAINRLVEIEESRERRAAEKDARRQALEDRDRELCARGVEIKGDPTFCERRGYEEPE